MISVVVASRIQYQQLTMSLPDSEDTEEDEEDEECS